MQKLLNTLREFPAGKENKDNFIKKALKLCKVFKVKPLKTPKPDISSKKTAYDLFAEIFERPKKSCREFRFPKQVQSYQRNGKRLKPVRRK